VDRLTRKDLKTDKFALEVEHGFEFYYEHEQEVKRYGAIALIVLLLVAGYHYYSKWQGEKQEMALNAAMQVGNAYVGANGPPGALLFPTQAAKEQAEVKAFTELAQKYRGSDVGTIAMYHLGIGAADMGNLPEAEKDLGQAANGSKVYAALAKLALARVYAATNRLPEAEKVLRWLVDHPTDLVSKEQATFALAETLAPTNCDEARKLLEPLRTERSAISRNALTVLGTMCAK
jgi:predicted negative regulator of RcsB-dependent stress response